MNHESPTEDYNPERDYHRAMEWVKYGAAVFAAGAILLRILIG